MRRNWLVGVDVGGTFTDGVLVRPGAEPLAAKSLSDPVNPVSGLRACLDQLAEAAGTDRRALLSRTGKLAYGTTLAANLLVEGRGARVGFITTRGFRDTLIVAGIGRERIGVDLTARRPPPLVPRHLIQEVRERVDARGRELAPVRMEDVSAAIAALEAEGVEAVGICLLWSFRNPDHELQVAQALRSHDGWFVTCSSEVAPLLGEYERSATTALNAILGPPVERYLGALTGDFRQEGLEPPVLVMQSTGGLLPPLEAARLPVSLLASGPAGGVLASKLLADAMGLPNVLCADVGGTTFDVSLIIDGEFATGERARHAGHDILAPGIDVESIGAGGGSLGWVDHAHRLKVGPRSAGAWPGPACYGRGGSRPTVTDAHCRLGRLNPDGLAGGRLRLDREAAVRALELLGGELGMHAVEIAEGMLAIVDAAMADAMRSQTVRRGLEPADFTLLAYGGAAPLHAATLAAELGISRVVVPTLAPVFSAFGAVASDLRHVLTLGVGAGVDEWAPIADGYRRLEEEAVRRLELDGVAPAGRALVRSAQARFMGQLHAVQVPVAGGDFDLAAAARLREAFIGRYERLFGAGTSSPEAGIEVTSLRLDAIGRTPRPELRQAIAAGAAAPARPEGRREIWWHGRDWRALRYLGPLPVGSRLAGPAVIDHPGHTVLVPPGVAAQVDGLGNLVMEL